MKKYLLAVFMVFLLLGCAMLQEKRESDKDNKTKDKKNETVENRSFMNKTEIKKAPNPFVFSRKGVNGTILKARETTDKVISDYFPEKKVVAMRGAGLERTGKTNSSPIFWNIIYIIPGEFSDDGEQHSVVYAHAYPTIVNYIGKRSLSAIKLNALPSEFPLEGAVIDSDTAIEKAASEIDRILLADKNLTGKNETKPNFGNYEIFYYNNRIQVKSIDLAVGKFVQVCMKLNGEVVSKEIGSSFNNLSKCSS